MQIHLRKKKTNIYKYILHVFSLGYMPRNVWRLSHVLAGISMFCFFSLFLFSRGWSSVTYRCTRLKETLWSKILQGNILKDFPLICLNFSDFSVLFNCIFLFMNQKNIDKKKKEKKYSALPREKKNNSNHILYLIVPKSTKATLSFFISVLHLFTC